MICNVATAKTITKLLTTKSCAVNISFLRFRLGTNAVINPVFFLLLFIFLFIFFVFFLCWLFHKVELARFLIGVDVGARLMVNAAFVLEMMAALSTQWMVKTLAAVLL